MSDHRIEDLVEDSIRLTLRSRLSDAEKRQLVRDLYVFQNLFDTSKTIGRVKPELDAIGYDPEMPAGDQPFLATIAAVVALADAASDRQLMHHWLGVLASEINELTLIDGRLPEDFPAFRQRAEAIAIRAAAIRHDVRNWRDRRGYVPLPSWTTIARDYERSDPETIDRRSMLRFLLDHRADPDGIAADYEKDKARAARIAKSVLPELPAMVAARGDFRLVTHSVASKDNIFVFQIGEKPPDADGARFYLLVEHHRSNDVLYPRFGVRSGLIERWQGRGFAADDVTMHFRISLSFFAPQAELEADLQFNGLGWPWRLNQSAKLLSQRLDSIVRHWSHAERLMAFYAKPLAQRIDEEGFETMARERSTRKEQFGYFTNEVDMLFACACRAWDRGERPSTEIAAIRDWLAHIHPSGRADRGACLARLDAGPAFPAVVETLALRRYDTPFPLEAA